MALLEHCCELVTILTETCRRKKKKVLISIIHVLVNASFCPFIQKIVLDVAKKIVIPGASNLFA